MVAALCCIGILELTDDDLVFDVVVLIIAKWFVGAIVVLRLCVVFFDVAFGVVDEVDIALLVVTVVSGMLVSMSGVVGVFIVVLSVGSVVWNRLKLKQCSGLNQTGTALEQGFVLSYAVEVWEYHPAPEIEKIHTKFRRHALGVKRFTNLSAL